LNVQKTSFQVDGFSIDLAGDRGRTSCGISCD
jgi:hypothetical protein